MPRPPTGRRPDSLFDNRYRYDHIFPRGRSGETLRAYDTTRDDLPVVIKRPALQDAPPIRAGQEVSILKEKRALEALSGHPVLTALRGSGTFRVGGTVHQYIVMDMARGETLEAITLSSALNSNIPGERNVSGEQLTPLELYNALDNFLDILSLAHDRGIIYNDVDAKHLFWDRDGYQLKLIDWGNAVFLDSEHPAGINRTSDIAQVGGLLYFLYSGGRRPETGVSDPVGGLDAPDKIKIMIRRALTTDSQTRYADIASIRRDLAELRAPALRERDILVERVHSRLPNAQTQTALDELHSAIEDAIRRDPGYPSARQFRAELASRLERLRFQSDLDAIRIYLDTGSYTRAADLLRELTIQPGAESSLTRFLLEFCALMTGWIAAAPAGIPTMLDLLFKDDYSNDYSGAARALMIADEPRADARLLTARIAEAMTRLLPGVVLLRPLLVLSATSGALTNADQAARAAFQTGEQKIKASATGLQGLLVNYTRAGEDLERASTALEAQVMRLNEDRQVANWLNQAQSVLERLIELLEVVSDYALSDAPRAGNALYSAVTIDPEQRTFAVINDGLNNLHAALEELRKAATWSDSMAAAYLQQAQTTLTPYLLDLKDKQLSALATGLSHAYSEYARLSDLLALGGRRPAASAARSAAGEIRALNGSLAAWFEDLAKKIEDAPHPEYLSANAALGRVLSDGWDAWDRGRGGEAAAAGDRALSVAATDGERAAAGRLRDLSALLSAWLTDDGSADQSRTQSVHNEAISLYMPDEDTLRRKFSDQMPNTALYLRAMNKGLVEPMQDASAAAIRVLFLDCVLRGVLAIFEDKPTEAAFWREAALKCLPNARTHPAAAALENAIARRELALSAVAALNSLPDAHTAEQLASARSAVRAPLAQVHLSSAENSLRALEEAIRKWQDGDFRSARGQVDTALDRAAYAETVLHCDLSAYKTWLEHLGDSADILISARRVVEEAAHVPSPTVDPAVADAHDKMVMFTRRDLGDVYASQLRAWRDSYVDTETAYRSDNLSLEGKQQVFSRHLNALLSDRAPALPLMRYWGNLITQEIADREAARLAALAPVSVQAFGNTEDENDPEDNLGDYPGNAPDFEVAPDRDSAFAGYANAPALDSSNRRAARTDINQASRQNVVMEAERNALRAAAAAVEIPIPDTDRIIDVPEDLAAHATGRSRSASGRLLLAGAVLVTLLVSGTIAFLLSRNQARGGTAPIVVDNTSGNTNGGSGDGSGTNGSTLNSGSSGSGSGSNSSSNSDATQVVALAVNTRVIPTDTLDPTATPTLTFTSAPTETPPPSATPSETPRLIPTIAQIVPSPTRIIPTEPVTPTLPPTDTATAPALSSGATPFAPRPTNPAVALPTLPPAAANGVYDLLPGLNTLDAEKATWDQIWFSRAGSNWQIGTSAQTQGDAPAVIFDQGVLTTLLGTESGQAVKRFEATLRLTTYPQNMVTGGQVYFGLGLLSTRSLGPRVDVRIKLNAPGVLGVGITQTGQYREKTQIPAVDPRVTIAVERNADSTLSTYIDGQLISASARSGSWAAGQAVNLYVYVSTGGVLVDVESLKVTLETQ